MIGRDRLIPKLNSASQLESCQYMLLDTNTHTRLGVDHWLPLWVLHLAKAENVAQPVIRQPFGSCANLKRERPGNLRPLVCLCYRILLLVDNLLRGLAWSLLTCLLLAVRKIPS